MQSDVCRIADCESLDLVFLLDSSGPIAQADRQSMVNFVAKMISRFDVGLDNVRIGLASYGDSGRMHFDLNDFYHLEAMILHIYSIPWNDQWTNTASGKHGNHHFTVKSQVDCIATISPCTRQIIRFWMYCYQIPLFPPHRPPCGSYSYLQQRW